MNPLPTAAQAVLDFWFGQPMSATPRPEWFRKDAAFDDTIRAQFGALVTDCMAGGRADWDLQPQGALARILVLDQFTRNIHRGTARAFDGDAFALVAARALTSTGQDRGLAPLQRWFVYLPFEHAEDRAAQAEAMRLFDELAAEHPGMADAREWAHKHRVVIDRFGRFPHRNTILGRQSTPEELQFLAEPGSSF